MDYETLYSLIPKEPKKWQLQDVSVWLDFIGLSQLQDKFSIQFKNQNYSFLVSLSVDGSILDQLSDNDLEEELGINQKIVKKKIMNWLTVGLKEYSQFIKDMKERTIVGEIAKEQICTLQKEKQSQMDFKDSLLQNSVKSNNGNTANQVPNGNTSLMSSLPLPIMQKPNIEEEVQIQQQPQQQQYQQVKTSSPFQLQKGKQMTAISRGQNKSENQLILQPMEGQQNNFYCINETGAKIGRHSSNQILILEENISRYHAEVTFENGMFQISDIGSTTGTYIKIQNKLLLEQNMLIELGSNLFQVTSIEANPGIEYKINLIILEGPNMEENYIINLSVEKANYMIGRKNTADLAFQDDHHLSNLHAKFYLIDERLYLEDYSSTNGTWLRLSPEGQNSQPYILLPQEQHIIRIGTTSQYMCIQNSSLINELPADSMCIICCEKERDSLYLPCKHNATCLKCSKNLTKCPICRVKITEQLRIYKN